jgi:prophage tail gpP-like protein
MTEYFPESGLSTVVQAGDPCKVFLGADLVLTGYVDEYSPKIDGQSHSVSLSGRSKCEDIVDCSAEYPNSQISGGTALSIAKVLASPYGITVTQISGGNPTIPQFNLLLGETAVEIIERVTRNSSLLYYDMPDGNLVLAQVGTGKMASGIAEGANVQSATAKFTMGQRYSEYRVVKVSFFNFNDANGGGGNYIGEAIDPFVRHRVKYIVSEAGDIDFVIAQARALWEAKRRFGKSYSVTVTVDSWRDSAGNLWTPNTLCNVNIPTLKIINQDWIIGEVTYARDDKQGTTATLLLCPATAYSVEPMLIQPISFRDATPASAQNGGQ